MLYGRIIDQYIHTYIWILLPFLSVLERAPCPNIALASTCPWAALLDLLYIAQGPSPVLAPSLPGFELV